MSNKLESLLEQLLSEIQKGNGGNKSAKATAPAKAAPKSAPKQAKAAPKARAAKSDDQDGVFFSRVETDAGRIKTPKNLFDAGNGRTFEYVLLSLPNGEEVSVYPNAGNGRGRLSDPILRSMNVGPGHTIVYTRTDAGCFDVHIEGKAQAAHQQQSRETVAPRQAKQQATAPKAGKRAARTSSKGNGAAEQTINGITKSQLLGLLAQFDANDQETVAPKSAPAKARTVAAPARAVKTTEYARPAAGRTVGASAYVVPARKGR